MGTTSTRPRGWSEYRALLPASLTVDPEADGSGRVRRSTRDWVVDVLCVLLAFIIGGLSYVGTLEEQHDVPDWVLAADLATGVVACCAVWLRRRWPVGLALAMVPIGLFSSMSGGASLIALFTVAVHRRFPVLALVTVANLAVLPVYFLLYPPEGAPYWFFLVFLILIIAVVVAWGMFVRARRQLVLSLRERARRAESEQQLRVEQARHHERERIAREMHDVLAHRISLLSLHAGALEFRPDAPAAEVAKAAGVIRDSAHQALQDLREVIGVLRGGAGPDAPIRPQPTLVDLPELVEESRQAGMRVRLESGLDDLTAVPASTGRSAYRIVQEGLTNARKHAPGAAVALTVRGAAGDGLTIEVRNGWPVGRADAQIPGAGSGLVGLGERANLAGGRLEHGRTPEGDFRLAAWLPWPA
jgi:signal transduction histidine kinase